MLRDLKDLVVKAAGLVRGNYIERQADVREFQLAKAAVASGIKVLLSRAGITAATVERVVIAGAFGAHINIGSARMTGLLPLDEDTAIEQAGNAAGAGACLGLVDSEIWREAVELSRRIEYIELAAAPEFKSIFTKESFFARAKARSGRKYGE